MCTREKMSFIRREEFHCFPPQDDTPLLLLCNYSLGNKMTAILDDVTKEIKMGGTTSNSVDAVH
jgi:hypothetical protein